MLVRLDDSFAGNDSETCLEETDGDGNLDVQNTGAATTHASTVVDSQLKLKYDTLRSLGGPGTRIHARRPPTKPLLRELLISFRRLRLMGQRRLHMSH